MFRLSPITFVQRSALPLTLFCAIGSPAASAATAGLCHYLTNTTIQNVTGHDLQLSSQNATGNFSIQPSIPTTWVLATGGVTGFSQTWGKNSQHDMGGQLVFQINDGQTKPQFQLSYWSGVGGSPGTVADAAGSTAQKASEEIAKDTEKNAEEDAALDSAEIAVPPPADAVIAAIKMLDSIRKIAKDIASAFQSLGYLNINQAGGSKFTTVNGVSVDTDQTHTIAIPGQSGSYYKGYVVSAISINNGCPNSWNVVVSNYCAYVCGYASGNNVPVADTGCLSNAYCSTLSNPLPGGSYTQSCSAIQWKNSTTLTAKCKDGLGIDRDASLDYYQSCAADSTVSNNNGVLNCDSYAASAVVAKPRIARF